MHRASAFGFAFLLLLAVAASWPGFLAPQASDWHLHLLGIAMILWLLMLVVQAALGRALAKTSYLLVPVLVAAMVLLAHYRLRAGLGREALYLFYVQAAMLAAFLVAQGGAILDRRTPAAQGRFMACTALALVDPILAPLLQAHFGMRPPWTQLATYGAVDLVLVALLLRDRRDQQYAQVYPGMLAVFVAAQVPTFLVPQMPWWKAFAQGFARLPLP